jgi:hypothetical protein
MAPWPMAQFPYENDTSDDVSNSASEIKSDDQRDVSSNDDIFDKNTMPKTYKKSAGVANHVGAMARTVRRSYVAQVRGKLAMGICDRQRPADVVHHWLFGTVVVQVMWHVDSGNSDEEKRTSPLPISHGRRKRARRTKGRALT